MSRADRVVLRRSGGLVASRPLETAVDLTSGDGDAVAVARLLEAVDVAELASRPPPSGGGADSFQYELTLETEGRCERFLLEDRSASPELRDLLERLEQRALAAARASRRRSTG